MRKNELVDIAGELYHQTASAYLVFDGDKKYWLPKSQVEMAPFDWTQSGKPIFIFTMPEWLAKEKGLI